ncbi:hypothetical protein GCM10011415_30630 [Salipiger pallidus]|uniref:GntR C-terminal domain-containing protein n=1 Tax=Salipiger pallidus TaxID=1775170 RepID=A0A8J3EI50_9RHOB|nr:hypothetical protein GCM10011415_30630 [Salipiger pallidus]
MTLKDVEELFASRLQLEPLAARLAAETGGCDIARLEHFEEMCRNHPSQDIGDQIDYVLGGNRGFHMTITAGAGNGQLCTALTRSKARWAASCRSALATPARGPTLRAATWN